LELAIKTCGAYDMLKTEPGYLKMKLNNLRRILGYGIKAAGLILAPCLLLERAAALAFKRVE